MRASSKPFKPKISDFVQRIAEREHRGRENKGTQMEIKQDKNKYYT